MNKQLRNLMIMAGVLVALLLVWLLSGRIPGMNQSQQTAAATTAAKTALLTVDPAEVAQIAVHNNLSDLVLLPDRSTDEAGKVQVTWHLAEDQGFPVSKTGLSALADAALSVSYSDIIVENPDDLAAFGLNRPVSTISIVLSDGSSKIIEFGSNLSSGKGVYARLGQDTRIYAVETRYKDLASQSLKDLVDLSQTVGGLTIADLSALTFTRRDDEAVVQAEVALAKPGDPASGLLFNLKEPLVRSGNADTLTSLLNSFLTLSAARIVDLDASDLERYGLAQPRYQLTLVSPQKGEVVVRIGDNAGNGQYFVTSSALPAIMTVQADALKAVDLPLVDYVDRFVALQSIWKVSGITLDLPGARHEMTLSIAEGQKPTDEAVVLTLDGKNAKVQNQSGSSLFSQFYQTLISIRIDGFDLAASPEGSVDYRITYQLKPDPAANPGDQAEVIEFIARDAYTDYVLINGRYTGFYVNHRDAFTSEQVGQEGLQVAMAQLQYAVEHAVDGVFDTSKGYSGNS